MTAWIVELDKKVDRDKTIARLKKVGDVTELKALKSMVMVEGDQEKIRRIAGVAKVTDPDQEAIGGATLSFTGSNPTAWEDNIGLAYSTKKTVFNGPQDFLIHSPHQVDFSPAEDGTGVDVYVVDSGVEAHTEFGTRLQTSLYNADSPPFHPHGTGMASILAGATMGMARNATVFSSQCFDVSNVATAVEIILAFDAAADSYASRGNPGVLNFSGYSTSASNPYGTMVSDCVDIGLPVVTITGNAGIDLDSAGSAWPGEDVDAFTVAGYDFYRRRHVDSSYGSMARLWGLQGPVRTAGSSNTFRYFTGTSCVAPIVSGIAARLLQGKSKMTTRAQVLAFYRRLERCALPGHIWDVDGTPKPDWKAAYLAA